MKLLDISTWFEQGGMISVKKGDETLNYQIDEDNQSIEVDKATRDYLVDIALVPPREFKKLKDTYIFYIQDLSDEDIVELEEIFECYIPVRMSDRWDGEMAHGGMMAKGGGGEVENKINKVADEYLYHGTGEGAFRRIREEGLTPQGEKYLYFADKEQYAKTYAQRKGNSFGDRVLRVKKSDAYLPDENTTGGDFKIKNKINPNDIEIKHNGKWIPIQEFADENIGIMPISKAVEQSLKETPEAGSVGVGGDVKIESLNPTGSIFVDYSSEQRDKMPLGKNIITYDKTAGLSPNKKITVYRGVPKDINEIQSGDFVTTNKQLAQDYAGDGKVISKEVRADEILDDKTEPLGEEYILREQSLKEEFEKISRDENGKMKIKFEFAKGGMIEESDIIEGAKFKIKSGIVFIVDEIEDDPEFGKLVRSSMEGGSKGKYRDTMEELIEFLNEEKAEKIMAKGGYAKGGKVRKRFQDKVEAVLERLEGSKVPKKYRKFYGLTYDASEADEAAKKIVGAQVKKYEKEHITLHKPLKSKNMATAKSKPKSKQGEKIKLISAHAKKIWKKEKEKWTDAVKRASVELKKAGKI